MPSWNTPSHDKKSRGIGSRTAQRGANKRQPMPASTEQTSLADRYSSSNQPNADSMSEIGRQDTAGWSNSLRIVASKDPDAAAARDRPRRDGTIPNSVMIRPRLSGE